MSENIFTIDGFLMSPDLPLVQHPLARSRSLEEAADIQTKFIGSPVELTQLDEKLPFCWTANRLAFDQLGIMASQYGAGVRARESAPGDAFHLVLPVARGGRVKQGRCSVELRPGRSAAICSPLVPIELAVESGYQGRVVAIPTRLMESALDALTGFAPRKPLRFEPLVDVSGGGGRTAARWLDFIVNEVDRGDDGLLASPLAQSRLADVLLSVLLGELAHNQSARPTHGDSAEPKYVRRAEEYLDANVHRHVSLPELASAVGIGVRTLGAAFRKYRGCSPMRFLQLRRLELARFRLLAAPGVTVTDVALMCGFEHFGRFSVAYRARFGESPSITMRRCKHRAT
ncbi:MAG: AraC family transcriptional regulator [Pseudomonadota bacterium]